MQLSIDGHLQTLVDIKTFREQLGLPQHFGVSYFEPKDYRGLGSIEQAGAELNSVRNQIIQTVPERLERFALLPLIDSLAMLFRDALNTINDRVGLREDEVEFAVAGFTDVLMAVAYACIENRSLTTSDLDFNAIYFAWVNSSTRISSQVHVFDHRAQPLNIQIINTAYGRAGLVVDIDEARHYVRDGVFACPAEGFMMHLLRDVVDRIMLAVV